MGRESAIRQEAQIGGLQDEELLTHYFFLRFFGFLTFDFLLLEEDFPPVEWEVLPAIR